MDLKQAAKPAAETLTVQKLRNENHGFLSKSSRFQTYNGNNPYIMEIKKEPAPAPSAGSPASKWDG